MPVPNEDAVWQQQPQFVQAAFTHQRAEKVLLPQGFKLSKLSDFDSLAPPGATTLSPWWSPFEDYEYDAGFENRVKLAQHFGVSIRELSRLLVAVKENWNSLKYLLVIQLRVPVYAFFGGVAGQLRIDAADPGGKPVVSKVLAGEASGKTKNLVGGASQFYIPNLQVDHALKVEARSLL